MSKIFGLSPGVTALIIAGIVAYFVFWLFPLLHSSYLSLRSRHQIKNRAIFVFTSIVLCYGLFSFVLVVIVIPVSLFRTYAQPQLEEAGYFRGGLFSPTLYYLAHNWLLLVPPLFALASFFITRRLASKWNHIAEILSG